MKTSLTLILITSLLCLCLHHASWARDGDEEEEKKLSLPRFVSLKSSEVNVRTGPGTRYPISWVFKREDMPVEIIEESDNWRKIKDYEGSEGWILHSMLSGRRTVLINGKTQTLYKQPDEGSAPMLRAEPMVIGKLLECMQDWCRLQIDGRKGWMKKANLWGVYAREEFEN